jgi:hypothetical protein
LGGPGQRSRGAEKGPSQTTHTSDNLDAPTCRLQFLTDSARGLQDALKRGFTMDIKISKLDLEKSLKDYKTTLERIAMAANWDKEITSIWEKKGRSIFGSLIGESDTALRKPKRMRPQRPGCG